MPADLPPNDVPETEVSAVVVVLAVGEDDCPHDDSDGALLDVAADVHLDDEEA